MREELLRTASLIGEKGIDSFHTPPLQFSGLGAWGRMPPRRLCAQGSARFIYTITIRLQKAT